MNTEMRRRQKFSAGFTNKCEGYIIFKEKVLPIDGRPQTFITILEPQKFRSLGGSIFLSCYYDQRNSLD